MLELLKERHQANFQALVIGELAHNFNVSDFAQQTRHLLEKLPKLSAVLRMVLDYPDPGSSLEHELGSVEVYASQRSVENAQAPASGREPFQTRVDVFGSQNDHQQLRARPCERHHGLIADGGEPEVDLLYALCCQRGKTRVIEERS